MVGRVNAFLNPFATRFHYCLLLLIHPVIVFDSIRGRGIARALLRYSYDQLFSGRHVVAASDLAVLCATGLGWSDLGELAVSTLFSKAKASRQSGDLAQVANSSGDGTRGSGGITRCRAAVWSRSDHDSCAVGKPWVRLEASLQRADMSFEKVRHMTLRTITLVTYHGATSPTPSSDTHHIPARAGRSTVILY